MPDNKDASCPVWYRVEILSIQRTPAQRESPAKSGVSLFAGAQPPARDRRCVTSAGGRRFNRWGRAANLTTSRRVPNGVAKALRNCEKLPCYFLRNSKTL